MFDRIRCCFDHAGAHHGAESEHEELDSELAKQQQLSAVGVLDNAKAMQKAAISDDKVSSRGLNTASSWLAGGCCRQLQVLRAAARLKCSNNTAVQGWGCVLRRGREAAAESCSRFLQACVPPRLLCELQRHTVQTQSTSSSSSAAVTTVLWVIRTTATASPG
jgi:hypothetical protein